MEFLITTIMGKRIMIRKSSIVAFMEEKDKTSIWLTGIGEEFLVDEYYNDIRAIVAGSELTTE